MYRFGVRSRNEEEGDGNDYDDCLSISGSYTVEPNGNGCARLVPIRLYRSCSQCLQSSFISDIDTHLFEHLITHQEFYYSVFILVI